MSKLHWFKSESAVTFLSAQRSLESPFSTSSERFTAHFGVVFLLLLMLVTHSQSWICGFIFFIKLGGFSALISSNLFSVLFPLSLLL